jgi:hypothetical protein
MAAAGFLALAHTFARGEHIRVTLILEHVGAKAHRAPRGLVACDSLPSRQCLRVLQHEARFQSWDFNDISTGNDATPLWIPQLTMAFGRRSRHRAVDALVLEWRGKRAHAAPAEAARR